MWLTWLIVIIAAYLMGSIPCAYLLVKLKNGQDIREFGSGNPGSTNSVRAAGPLIGSLVFICDGLKSAIPTLVGLLLSGPGLAVCAGFAAFLGHIFPIWLSFRGGKGVACTLGIGLVLAPYCALIALGVWLLTIIVTGYVSLGSCCGVLVAFLLCLFTAKPWMVTLFFAVAMAMVLVRHRSNFQHIKDGTENKVRWRR